MLLEALGYPKQLLSDSSKVAGHRQPWQHIGIHPKSRPEKSKSLNSEPENKFSVEIAFQTEIQSGEGDLIKENKIALERKVSS